MTLRVRGRNRNGEKGRGGERRVGKEKEGKQRGKETRGHVIVHLCKNESFWFSANMNFKIIFCSNPLKLHICNKHISLFVKQSEEKTASP